MDEPELHARLRNGDDQAFAAVFREHYAALVGSAERLLGDRAAAEDTAQEVMLEMWRRREALPDDMSLRAYLHQSARNRALNRIRHARVVRQAEPHVRPPTASAPADGEVSALELEAAAKQAVADLPEDVRETFRMSRVDGLTYGEIAKVMEVSVKTVEARMGRALRLLRERLAQWLPEGGGW
ncbi:MAG TPA: RNA polymerase sigma-70 factor [Longimicrobium sp.]|nr:RNA polymerase sigma-70 factor [Longimicrobium sp.]